MSHTPLVSNILRNKSVKHPVTRAGALTLNPKQCCGFFLARAGVSGAKNEMRTLGRCWELAQLPLGGSKSRGQIVRWCMPELRRIRLCTSKCAQYFESGYQTR